MRFLRARREAPFPRRLCFGLPEIEALLTLLYSRRSGTSACSNIIAAHFLKWSALFGCDIVWPFADPAGDGSTVWFSGQHQSDSGCIGKHNLCYLEPDIHVEAAPGPPPSPSSNGSHDSSCVKSCKGKKKQGPCRTLHPRTSLCFLRDEANRRFASRGEPQPPVAGLRRDQ